MRKYISFITSLLLLLSCLSDRKVYAQLVMTNNYYVVLSGGTKNNPTKLVLTEPTPFGIVNMGSSWIISESEFNMVQWNIGTNTGNYRIRFGYGTSDSLPLTCGISSAGAGNGYILFSTYHCPSANNSPYPSDVTNLTDLGYPNDSLGAVDRFWILDAEKYSTKPTLDSIQFTYIRKGVSSEIELPNLIQESELIAQRFNNNLNEWPDWYGEPYKNDTSKNTGTVSSGPIAFNDFYRSWCLFDSNHITNIPLIKYSSSINVFPNPNYGSFTVSGLTLGQVIELYNYLGQRISSINVDKTIMLFDISSRANGIYLLRIQNNEGGLVTQKRIVKVN